jgi:ABC-2 type transport system permease protein
MMSDIWTIMWKEWKEYLVQRGGIRQTIMSNLLLVLVFGVFLPLQTGRDWITSPASMIAWDWLPLFLATGMIADSFAGERERHTLETLLASRMSDRAILLGKIAAAVAYAVLVIVVLMTIGLITINLTTWNGHLLLYPAAIIAGLLAFGLLGSALVSALGVLISLRAATVRQAAQTLSIGIVLLVWVPVLAFTFLPTDVTRSLEASLSSLNITTIALLFVIILVIVDTLLLLLAVARFQRARLILD